LEVDHLNTIYAYKYYYRYTLLSATPGIVCVERTSNLSAKTGFL